jgi:tetratricopeptide (TPR) repeat protein
VPNAKSAISSRKTRGASQPEAGDLLWYINFMEKTLKKKGSVTGSRIDPDCSRPSQGLDASFLLQKKVIHIVLIAVLGLLAYSNTFHSPFMWDERREIIENPVIKDLDNFLSSTKGYDYNPRRFIGYLTFALNYHFGGLNVTGYHVVNLAIHIANALLVYYLVILTFRTPSMRQSTDPSPPAPVLLALFTALLFVAHPLQTQAVTYVVQRFASLATLCYLLSLVMYVKGRLSLEHTEETVKKERFSASISAFTCFFLSLVFAVCAMKTKEIAFTLPLVIALYEVAFFKASLKKKLLFLLPVVLTLIIVPLSILHSDKPLGEILSDVSEKTKVQTTLSRREYLMTEMRVIVTYLRLIFVPVKQNLDYDYPIYHSLFTPPVFLSFVFLVSIFGAAVYLLYRSQRAESKEQGVGTVSDASCPMLFAYYRLIAFGVLWFFITLSVESSVIPIADVIFEHRVYLPSIGLFLAITTGVFVLANRLRMGKVVIPVFVVVTLILSGVTYARNTVWANETTFWEDVVKKSPNKARPRINLGTQLLNKGFVDKAIEQYLTAVALNPYDNLEAYIDLGAAFFQSGWTDKAIEQYQTALRIDPEYAPAHNNLGLAFFNKGLTDKAIEQYQIALKLQPESAEAHNNLGLAFFNKGLTDKAIEQYQIALNVWPDFAKAYNNLGIAYAKSGMLDKAIEYCKTAIRLQPDYALAHYNLGEAYREKGLKDQAIEHLETAVSLSPDNQLFRNDLAEAYKSKSSGTLAR